MSLQIRRVVTGHDSTGRARVKIDEMAQNVISNRPGASSCVVWSTDSWPIDNSGDDDPSGRKIGTTIDNGTVFRILRLESSEPCHSPINQLLDYAVVLAVAG